MIPGLLDFTEIGSEDQWHCCVLTEEFDIAFYEGHAHGIKESAFSPPFLHCGLCGRKEFILF